MLLDTIAGLTNVSCMAPAEWEQPDDSHGESASASDKCGAPNAAFGLEVESSAHEKTSDLRSIGNLHRGSVSRSALRSRRGATR
jgi:hypothetical protein